MESKDISKAIEKLRSVKKRNFAQSFDLIFNLKNLNLKKPEENINIFVVLPHGRGKPSKVCAFVDQALSKSASESCDKSVLKDKFKSFNKASLKRLAKEFDFFIAQADLMPDVAKYFGKVLGPRGKMPNPKAGCVVPPTANLKPVAERLKKTINLSTKSELIIKCSAGTESMDDEKLVQNITTIYNALLHALPQDKNNIKNVLLKLTMSSPIHVGREEKDEKSS